MTPLGFSKVKSIFVPTTQSDSMLRMGVGWGAKLKTEGGVMGPRLSVLDSRDPSSSVGHPFTCLHCRGEDLKPGLFQKSASVF